jgi:hypothetical protein
MSLDTVRTIADAVLYEGYLLYPYRASSAKNRSRWQFGVLGPPAATVAAFAEAPDMAMQCLLAPGAAGGTVRIHLRFLQLQVREVQRLDPDGSYVDVSELTVAGSAILSWDEAVEREITLAGLPVAGATDVPVRVSGGRDIEPIVDPDGSAVGRIVRRRWPLTARLRTRAEADDGYLRMTVAVTNEHPEPVADKADAIRSSLIGAHLLLAASEADFVSLLEPPPAAAAAAGRCRQHRCWPVLAGPAGATDVVLGAPIILYDHPEVAEQSPGALYDSTEIDEILTLRVMTMTEAEKAEARATDPRARAIIDRCDAMSAAELQQLHGILRDPGAFPTGVRDARSDVRDVEPPTFDTGELPWWDPAVDTEVRPESDAVFINGVRVAKGSLVRVHPSRRADAQDLFFADQVARVTAVLADVDGGVHVALVLVDDPAADLHDWYGRYFYFAPDELEPLPAATEPAPPEEDRS